MDATMTYNGDDEEALEIPDLDSVRVTPEESPLMDWLNHAELHFDHEKDCLTFVFSVTDPRGGFEVNVYRVPDDSESENAGKILLTVPHADMSGPHAPLRQIAPGAYVIDVK